MKNIHILPTENYSPLVHSTSKYGGLFLSKYYSPMKVMGDSYQHIYITSDEEIKEGDWMYYKHFGEDIICKYDTLGGQNTNVNEHKDYYKKIILTTDQDLIKELEQIDQNNTVTRGSTALVYKQGVQPIDNDFLEWFVKNPSCEDVEIERIYIMDSIQPKNLIEYKIIIPKEETERGFVIRKSDGSIMEIPIEYKQETLEEAMESYLDSPLPHSYKRAVEFGAKWQQERMYSEEDMIEFSFNTYHYISELMGVPFNLISENKLHAMYNFEQFKKK